MIIVGGEALVDLVVDPEGSVEAKLGGGPFNTARTIGRLGSEVTFLGALNMLGLAKRTGARIFLASTSEVYGDPIEHPQAESYRGNVNPIGPRACYDEGKRMAEALFFDYHRQHRVDIKVVRIFNTYGPRMNPGDGRVVSNTSWFKRYGARTLHSTVTAARPGHSALSTI